MLHANPLIHANCNSGHFHDCVSRRTNANVGRHCMASVKNTNNEAAVGMVNNKVPSARRLCESLSSSDASSLESVDEIIISVLTKTSRARKLVSTATVS